LEGEKVEGNKNFPLFETRESGEGNKETHMASQDLKSSPFLIISISFIII
jgi:hypothetical protein